MIVGIDASRANRKDKTGVEWYAWHLIQELKKITPEEHKVILYSDSPLTGELAQLPGHWRAKILYWPLKRLWTQLRLSGEMLIHRPDVLWIPAHVFPVIHPQKTVMTVHDLAAFRFPQAYPPFERWYSLWSARYAGKKLWRLIVPSKFTKNEIASAFGLHTLDKIVVVHHGYDTRYRKLDDKPALEAVLKKYHLKRPFVMSVGRLEKKKNTVNIIRAFTQLRPKIELQLALIGLPGYGYEEVKEIIAQSAYKQDIRLLGWLPVKDIALIINAAEIFVFPSIYEGFGIPVLEAMACGTPVVAGSGSSMEEVSGDCAVYVDPHDYEALAREISRLINDKVKKNCLAEKGLAQVKNFSWKKAAQDTLRVLLDEK